MRGLDAAKAAGSDRDYDAFLSHSSADRRSVARMQAFLEAYSFGAPRRRVRVFRDYSDLPGGELDREIELALTASRFLIVVSSPAAIDSRWVDKEIRAYDAIHGDSTRIGVAVLHGQTCVEAVEALKDREYLRHDLTKGWILGIPRFRTRLELLRILSMITGQSMRSLARWHLLRTLTNWSLATLIALAPFLLYMFQRVSIWEPIVATTRRGRVYAAAAEVRETEGHQLRVTYRFRGQGPQGFRNYFAVLQDAFQADSPSPVSDRFDARRRLLPKELVEWNATLPLLSSREVESLSNRAPAGDPFIGRPREGHFVIVQPLQLTAAEEADAQDEMTETGRPVPPSKGALVSVLSPSRKWHAVVEDLNPHWRGHDLLGNPTSPSLGLPVVWDDELGLWLGAPGWDGFGAGGVWRSHDGGRTWERRAEFKSVNSIGIIVEDGVRCLVLSELHFDDMRESLIVPYPSRVALSRDGGSTWGPADMPPFGSRSEIEFAGTLGLGHDVVRVDESLFQRKSVPRWRAISRSYPETQNDADRPAVAVP